MNKRRRFKVKRRRAVRLAAQQADWRLLSLRQAEIVARRLLVERMETTPFEGRGYFLAGLSKTDTILLLGR